MARACLEFLVRTGLADEALSRFSADNRFTLTSRSDSNEVTCLRYEFDADDENRRDEISRDINLAVATAVVEKFAADRT